IARLGDLLRLILELPETPTIPVRKEMEFLNKYLDVERIRYSDRLKVQFEIQTGCDERPVPALILQPIVENSIRHGVSATSDQVTIRITVIQEDSRLILAVCNDGPSLPDGWSMEKNAHVGLRNVAERLNAMYHHEYRLEIQSIIPAGVRTRITIPLR
ncbi:histidine kinase, partial [candidate division KSB1 bacterium]|nr:histidine kinase [candidate division KSB1 bacterium]